MGAQPPVQGVRITEHASPGARVFGGVRGRLAPTHGHRGPYGCPEKCRRSTTRWILRVLVLGDSVAAGSGDETGYGIAGRLRQELNSPTVEVANGGIPGARIHDVLRAMRSRKDQVRKSDVIVLSIGGNDLYGSQTERAVALLSPDLRMNQVRRRIELGG